MAQLLGGHFEPTLLISWSINFLFDQGIRAWRRMRFSCSFRSRRSSALLVSSGKERSFCQPREGNDSSFTTSDHTTTTPSLSGDSCQPQDDETQEDKSFHLFRTLKRKATFVDSTLAFSPEPFEPLLILLFDLPLAQCSFRNPRLRLLEGCSGEILLFPL